MLKRICAFFLSVLMWLMPWLHLPQQPVEEDLKLKYTNVFVHGLGGWGEEAPYYDIMPYWGMFGGDLMQYLNDKVFHAVCASVSPRGSAWDRACELYAELAGTRVDYGKAHSERCGHERFGRDFSEEPLIPDWSSGRKIVLLGHSFGGRIIIKLCARELPFTVDKVVLVDAAGVLPEKSPWEKFKQKLIALTGWFFKLAIIQKLFPHLIEALRRRSGSADYNAATPVMRQTLVKVVNEDLCDLMPHITCPTLLIWGTADTATPFSDAVKMNSLMPESAIVRLEGAGHFSFLDCQPQYLRVLASFFNVS